MFVINTDIVDSLKSIHVLFRHSIYTKFYVTHTHTLSPPSLFSLLPFLSGRYISLLEVYHPRGSSFKKSNPGPPQFRVCVVSPHDPFPSPSLLNQLTSLTPPAALRCCVVDGSSLTYYTITQGIVPSSSSPPPTT